MNLCDWRNTIVSKLFLGETDQRNKRNSFTQTSKLHKITKIVCGPSSNGKFITIYDEKLQNSSSFESEINSTTQSPMQFSETQKSESLDSGQLKSSLSIMISTSATPAINLSSAQFNLDPTVTNFSFMKSVSIFFFFEKKLFQIIRFIFLGSWCFTCQ